MPLARLLIATSRLRPGMDGGSTIATLQRARMLADGGFPVTLLTVDLIPDNTADREGFVQIGLADERTELRNLLQEVRHRPEILRGAALDSATAPAPAPALLDAEALHPDPLELDGHGRPWRQLVRDAAGAVVHTDFFDEQGRPLFRLPYLQRPDWWRAAVRIPVFDERGAPLGTLDGFRGLYRAWWGEVVREARDAEPRLPVVAIAEARQVGELLAGIPGLPVVHTVHSAHTLAPHAWDSPMDPVWEGWLDTLPRYDAVVWLTERQRADVVRRRGREEAPGWVIPHPALVPADATAGAGGRDPLRAITIARLAPVKRLDQLVEAWALVVERHPGARLDVYGEGPLRPALEQRIAELGLTGSITLHGHRDGAAEEARTAAVMVLTSAYEGQSLVIAEAMARGCPAVAYDIAYGPAEMITDGVSGRLVPSGDVAALAEAIAEHLGDPALLAERSRAALAWACEAGPARALERWRALIGAVAAPSTRQSSTP
ncbi:glycosyltransferase [Microcella frigidaquae]|uniref:Poly(Glycerol-phosphate) alpha-glucosyltransferase n=1 Tax=Microcella frigidaquae TaxID=424758 RepID=A0A840XHX6_9MICO|nr:poly(glycerol-phosphate) alpha-glucosyltransferase [Microcella frigidaquae]